MLAAALGGLLCAASGQAEERAARDHSFEITPFAGYMAGGKFEDPLDGSDRDVEEGTNWGAFLSLNDFEGRYYELLFSSQGTQVDGETPLDMDVQYLHIGGHVTFSDSKYVVPVFGMTIGATRFSPGLDGLDDETKLSFSVGGGVKVPITDHIGVRLDARAFVTLLDTDSDLFCVSTPATAGCRIRARSDTFVQYSAMLGVIAGF